MPELRDGALGQGCALPLTPSPFFPSRGEGPGVRGQNTLKRHTAAHRKDPTRLSCKSTAHLCDLCASVVKNTTDTRLAGQISG
ncbi:hypothetical protein LBMAG46_22260 [Planctomycetia bacterium]|nr:hypothetical protein LBMAG46_22260 [Planctomycetia bacterium]